MAKPDLGQSNAVLPEDLEEDTVASMMTGETAWTVPWGLWVDDSRGCWLHPGYTVQRQPQGTAQMRIERREDGYHVWVGRCDYKWSPSGEPGYASPRDTEYIPVRELHR